jgi:hypothetical protein
MLDIIRTLSFLFSLFLVVGKDLKRSRGEDEAYKHCLKPSHPKIVR